MFVYILYIFFEINILYEIFFIYNFNLEFIYLYRVIHLVKVRVNKEFLDLAQNLTRFNEQESKQG